MHVTRHSISYAYTKFSLTNQSYFWVSFNLSSTPADPLHSPFSLEKDGVMMILRESIVAKGFSTWLGKKIKVSKLNSSIK